MTEAEWLVCEDSTAMLELLRGRAGDRKLRLFSVACYRRIWHLLPDEKRNSVGVVEHLADGIGDRPIADAFHLTRDAWQAAIEDAAIASLTAVAAEARADTLAIQNALGGKPSPARAAGGQYVAEAVPQSRLLRDIFGNPFRTTVFSSEWRTDTASALAKQMYDSRDFGAMPILADALQDAGCESEDILNHCRDVKAAHVRGCWAVDLVLGKE